MSERFRFALENAQASHWQLFEYLASSFLSDEYGTLRTLASTSGDGGRDAILYQPEDDETTALQYSVTKEWQRKVRHTLSRLSTTHPKVQFLIFVSPSKIGADADDVRKQSRHDFHVSLDVRDQSWFVEREDRSATTRAAADHFSSYVVDPLLKDARVIDHGGITLDSDESKAALLYLVLQRQDDTQDRGLTKLCFDAVVKALLRNTDNDHRLSRSRIHDQAEALFPSHDPATVCSYVDRALERLNKQVVRHYVTDDTWLLAYDERLKIAEGVVRLTALDTKFGTELAAALEFVATSLEVEIRLVDQDALMERTRRVLERFLYERGERFAEAVTHGQGVLFDGVEVEECVKSDLLRRPDYSSLREVLGMLIARTIERILISPSETARALLKAIVDGYTLFAFMHETPNVQAAVTKLFSQGNFWLDTTAVLPILAESLLPISSRGYSNIIAAAIGAGAHCYITSGVLDELVAHIDMSYQAWVAPREWNGKTPFLLEAYIWSGKDSSGFGRWLETFRGMGRPLDDMAVYLQSESRIRVLDFGQEVSCLPDELRWHSDAYWREVHERRRSGDANGNARPSNPDVIERLARHDSEVFVGVLALRMREDRDNPFGYTTWWLTLDGAANKASVEVAQRSGVPILFSPVVSFEFLTYYLAVGPARRQLQKSVEQQLPLAVDAGFLDTLPRDLLAAAEKARQDVQGQEDRLVQRKVRDLLDAEKIRRSRTGRSGLERIKEDLRIAFGSRRG